MVGPRALIVLGVAVAAIVLFVVLRPAGDEDASPAAPTATAPTGPAAETEVATETSVEATVPDEEEPEPEPEPGGPVTVRILVRGGVPEGGIRRVTVQRGDDVRLVVRADVRDHVHLHGYDIMRDVGPGAPAQIRFRATIPGVFEAELEDRGLQVAEIEVRP